MGKKLENLLSVLIILLFLPLIITILMQRAELEKWVGSETAAETDEGEQEVERLLPEIVANEIALDASPEAIKAQCVIARTNYLLAQETGGAPPEAISKEQRAKFAEQGNFYELYQQLEQYVKETQGEVLQYEGRTINAEYHAISAGRTRDIAEAVEGGKMPYLTVVDCREDISAEGYLGVSYFSEEEFLEICQAADMESVQITARDTADYVLKIRLGDRELTGEEFRELLHLPSAHFSITCEEKSVRIITKGVGHGYGLSQHKAGLLAKDGLTYREILAHFFPGTVISK